MQITDKDIVHFAEDVVNLPSEHAVKYRRTVEDLCEKLEEHIANNEDYRLKRMMLSGSLAKRTSLRTISDADVALYVQSDDAPGDMMEFLDWLATELATLYPHINREDIKPKNFSVSISFSGRGLDVDVVPIYWLNQEWDGDLVSQEDGRPLRTNIPQHLKFIETRHKDYPSNFKQVVRLLKYWANECKVANEDFRFKSFMIELIVAHLADKKRLSLRKKDEGYTEILREFFDCLVKGVLDEVISFNDFDHGSVRKQDKPINIFDPVNPENNIAEQYTQQNKDLILDAAMKAADAIEYASWATTKEEALRQWRKVFGSSFNA